MKARRSGAGGRAPECGRRFHRRDPAGAGRSQARSGANPSAEKVISGVRRACQGRQDPTTSLVADKQVEDSVRAAGVAGDSESRCRPGYPGPPCARLDGWPTYGSRRSTGRFLPRTISRARLRSASRTPQPISRDLAARLPATLSPQRAMTRSGPCTRRCHPSWGLGGSRCGQVPHHPAVRSPSRSRIRP